MFIRFRLIFKNIFNNRDLPHVESLENVKCYELEISQDDKALLRIPFNENSKKLIIELYDNDTVIGPDRLLHTNIPAIGRLKHKISKECPVKFKIYKIVYFKKVGFVRKITNFESNDQNEVVFTIEDPACLHKMDNWVNQFSTHRGKTFKIQRSLKLRTGLFKNVSWLTQREFYGSCCINECETVEIVNIDKINSAFLKPYANKKFENTLELLKTFGCSISKDIQYHNDVMFEKSGVSTDAGDSMIEMTAIGDCEDFAHFYMRQFRILMNIYMFFLNEDDALVNQIKNIYNNYIPMICICQVELHGKPQFHSTLMLLSDSLTNIGFEVTDPEFTMYVDDKEYLEIHKEHFFLLTNHHIVDVKGQSFNLKPKDVLYKVRNL